MGQKYTFWVNIYILYVSSKKKLFIRFYSRIFCVFMVIWWSCTKGQGICDENLDCIRMNKNTYALDKKCIRAYNLHVITKSPDLEAFHYE